MHISFAGWAMLLPLLALAPTAPAKASEPTLHALVESAWQRSPQARTLLARQDETAAAQALAASWLAAAPVLGVSQRSDRWTEQRKRREDEVSLSTPLWLPGQKARRMDLAQASAHESDALLAKARLDIAGQVRNRLWEAAAAREVEREKEDHWQHLRELAQDVDRRVAGGDLPRSDSLLAQQEVASARAAMLLARREAREALARLTLLTGAAALPEPVAEPVPASSEPAPLRVHAAQAAERRARAAVAAASAQAAAAPTLALTMRRERDGALAPSERSVGVALQIPLVGKQRNRPAETAAATQLASASAELAMAQAEVELELDLARSRVRDAVEGVALAQQRATAMEEHTRLLQRAFALGERSLAELLRSRIMSHEARIAVRQQHVALGQAHAGLNQALGIIP